MGSTRLPEHANRPPRIWYRPPGESRVPSTSCLLLPPDRREDALVSRQFSGDGLSHNHDQRSRGSGLGSRGDRGRSCYAGPVDQHGSTQVSDALISLATFKHSILPLG